MQAIILAAGRGSRLGSLTDSNTKCMVEVCKIPLIERSIKSILDAGINKIIIVVGYKKEGLKKYIKEKFPNTNIKFIFNKDYYRTNNIYSLYIASEELAKDDTILLESDLIFDTDILKKLISDTRKNLAVVDRYKNWHDGTVVKLNAKQEIQSFIPKSEFKFKDLLQYYKTVNIYKFSKEFSKESYLPFLKAYCEAFGRSEYYEDVLRVIALIQTKSLEALTLTGQSWYEIDTPEDREVAEIIFSNPSEKYELLTKTYGGYWRFNSLIDFCYLVNPFFPPSQLNDELNFNLPKLIQSYPSGSSAQSRLAGQMFNVDSSHIVTGNGSAELIKLASKILKKRFGLYGPTFDEYTSTFKHANIKPLSTEGFRYGKEEILSLAEDNDGVILINPDNPSGNFIPHKDILDILNEFKSNNKTLILDESFLDFAEEGFNSSCCDNKILNNFPNLIVIKSIGKSYGVGGLRLGVLLSSNTDLVNELKSRIPIWNINSIAEFYLQIIPKYKSDYIKSCKKLIETRKSLQLELNKIPYIECYDSQANYFLCKLIGKNSRDLAINLCDKHSLFIKDCSHKCNNSKDQYIRVAVRSPEDNKKLTHALKNYET